MMVLDGAVLISLLDSIKRPMDHGLLIPDKVGG